MFKLDWSVYPLTMATNFETVNIQMHPRPSGIFEKTEKGSRSYVKKTGVIAFSQAYNEQIFVIIHYPTVEEITYPLEFNLLGRFNPEEITEEFILSKVELFIEEMTKWESALSSNRKIGF